jgi:hypothetical protein
MATETSYSTNQASPTRAINASVADVGEFLNSEPETQKISELSSHN